MIFGGLGGYAPQGLDVQGFAFLQQTESHTFRDYRKPIGIGIVRDFGPQNDQVMLFCSMLNAFSASKTAESSSQQGLGLLKSVFKFSHFAEIANGV